MKLSYVREFLMLEQIREFQSTAKELSIMQSTLSKHIKALEEELGVLLFERTKQSVTLSEFGAIFLPYARQLAALEDDYRSSLCATPPPLHPFIIGLSPSVLQYKIVELLLRFRAECTDFPVTFQENDSNFLREKVRNGECSCAFIRENSEDEDPDFFKLQFARDALIAALPKNHPLAVYPAITLSQLQKESFLLLEEASPVYQLCISECRKAGSEPNVIYTGTSGQSLLDLVDQGVGVSLTLKTPKRFKRQNEIVFVDVVPKAESYIHLIYRRDNFSPGINAFLRFIKPFLGYD